MEEKKSIIIRATTVPQSLGFFEGTMPELIESYDVQLLSSPGEEIDELGARFGIKTHTVDMFRRLSPIKDLRSLHRIIKIFRHEKPYMVHSMTPKAGLLCMLAAWWTKVPVRVHTFTGLVWPTAKGLQRWILKMTDRITCFCATHVIPEGQGVLNDLKAGGITNKEMKVLGYGNVKGIDMTRFSHRPEIMEKAKAIRKDDVFTFLFVGRIVKDKGINELVETYIRLHDEYRNVRLILVGSFEESLDPISPTAKEQIEKTPDIIVAGEQSGDDLIAYYAAADCFVFPSYREGFPNTVIEAGAMELPCIVTDINGSREIITGAPLQLPPVDGDNEVINAPVLVSVKQNGIIIPSKDVEALYEAMKRMVTDKEMREGMVKNARPMIERLFRSPKRNNV